MKYRYTGKKRRGDQQRMEPRRSSGWLTSPRDSVPPVVQLAKTGGNQASTRLIQAQFQGPQTDQVGGYPLDLATRAAMEGYFGQDFSGVLSHSDMEAGAAARALNLGQGQCRYKRRQLGLYLTDDNFRDWRHCPKIVRLLQL